MKKFHFYSKHDSKKETIMTITSLNLEDALECFCITKQLSQKDFKKLFKIEEAK